jgi:tryptophan-rich sensory protein
MNELASMEWYAQLIKPSWAPPADVFGPVWSVLYAVIAISFGAVLFHAARGNIPKKILIPFAINLVANALYSPIQFGLRNNELASVDILIVLGTLAWAMAAIWPHRKWIAYAQIPYFCWVAFATGLQLTITYLNYGR